MWGLRLQSGLRVVCVVSRWVFVFCVRDSPYVRRALGALFGLRVKDSFFHTGSMPRACLRVRGVILLSERILTASYGSWVLVGFAVAIWFADCLCVVSRSVVSTGLARLNTKQSD